MSTIVAFCHGNCGRVEVSVRYVRLVYGPTPRTVSVRFRCPRCRMVTLHPVHERDEAKMLHANVLAHTIAAPVIDSVDPHAPLFDDDDSIAFHDLLAPEGFTYGDVAL